MFRVVYQQEAARKDIPALNRDIKSRVKKAIESRLTRAPQNYGKPLSGNLHGYWSLRVGDYRIVYQIESPLVKIIQIVNRKEAYQAGILEARKRGWLS